MTLASIPRGLGDAANSERPVTRASDPTTGPGAAVGPRGASKGLHGQAGGR